MKIRKTGFFKTFEANTGLQNVDLTGNVLFLTFHLLLQLCQQRLTLAVDGECDCVEVIT